MVEMEIKKIAVPDFSMPEAVTLESWEKQEDNFYLKKLWDNSGVADMYRQGFGSYKVTSDIQKAIYTSIIRAFNIFLSGQSVNLCFLGNYGAGKTHLACSFLYEAMHRTYTIPVYELSAHYTIKYVLCDAIREQYQQAKSFSSVEKQSDVIKEYLSYDVLVLDEVGRTLDLKEESQLLYRIIDGRTARGKSTILISNLSIQDFSRHLGGATMDRLSKAKFLDFSKIGSYRKNGNHI